MADIVYNRGLYLLGSGGLTWTSDTIKCMLVSASYTPADTHNTVSDVVTYELSGTGYTGGFSGSGRHTLTGCTVTEDDTNDRVTFDCDDLVWTSIDAGTIAYLVFYKSNTTDANSSLIMVSDPTNVVTVGGTVTYTIPAAGLFYMEQP